MNKLPCQEALEDLEKYVKESDTVSPDVIQNIAVTTIAIALVDIAKLLETRTL